MMKHALSVLILSAGVSLAADSITPLDVKIGLWETTTVTERSGIPALPAETLAKLPPEQRARIEAQVKAMNASKTSVTQSCFTKEDLSRPFTLTDDTNKSCKQTILSSSGTKQEIRMDCEISGNKATSNVKFEAVDSGHVNGVMTMNAGAAGRGMDMKINITGKWIGYACGDVKSRSIGKEE